ncbi:hypothetical protein [Nonomuraea sediminis]|uniref:hypothetical protein n=1 Tax=Nonomuraea sediminis TaxID=2835864 RepID=UPI001BDD3D93|nr:hypothetical protein [Nonomuraea sediminis]
MNVSVCSRPASRLAAVQALSALLFAALTLPVSTPDRAAVPDWVQLSGLVMLLALYGTALHTWRLVIVGGLRPGSMLHQQIRDDRRLRLAMLSYPALVVLLLPIPSDWTGFWFCLTLASAVSGVVSLVRMSTSRDR